MAADDAYLKLHLEPSEAIEVGELTAALGSLSRQYQHFVVAEGLSDRAADGKLLVSSVRPGSIDILFDPTIVTAGAMLFPIIDKYELVKKFGSFVGDLVGLFLGEKKGGKGVTIQDCDDAINIAAPIANHGGKQKITVIHGGVHHNVLVLDAAEARRVVERATATRGQLVSPASETRQRVSMIWTRLDRGEAKTEGTSSPDKGIIEEIEPKAKAILFTDAMQHIKKEMVADQENPMQMVYFVDVEVSRINGRVTSYRVVGYHGKDELET